MRAEHSADHRSNKQQTGEAYKMLNVPFPHHPAGVEVYLYHAEAMNEYAWGGQLDEVPGHLNEIRTRAGLPLPWRAPILAGRYEISVITSARSVYGECNRCFGIRRWFTAHGPNVASSTTTNTV